MDGSRLGDRVSAVWVQLVIEEGETIPRNPRVKGLYVQDNGDTIIVLGQGRLFTCFKKGIFSLEKYYFDEQTLEVFELVRKLLPPPKKRPRGSNKRSELPFQIANP